MIQANEVRIGNRIINPLEEWDIVTHVGESAIKTNGLLGWQDLDLFKPIPLTPEILEKAGFILSNWVEHQGLTVYILDEIFNVRISSNGNYYFDGWKLNGTFHQLQSIYYSLTGKELNLAL